MKILLNVVVVLFIAFGARGQSTSSPGSSLMTINEGSPVAETLKKGAWEFGMLGGGGVGFGKSDNTQFFYAGGRAGWILTSDHLPGWLHGNFEWAADVLPVYTVFPPNSAVYGASIKPVIWQWNFTSHKRVAPYTAIAGGIVFTTSNVPPGDTSSVNFTPQWVFGVRSFSRTGRALFFESSIAHLSNASLGAHNPGYNASILFTVGYSWFRVPR
jgi:hypothetical protein